MIILLTIFFLFIIIPALVFGDVGNNDSEKIIIIPNSQQEYQIDRMIMYRMLREDKNKIKQMEADMEREKRNYPKPKLSKECYEELKRQGIDCVSTASHMLPIDDCYKKPIEEKILEVVLSRSPLCCIDKGTNKTLKLIREALQREGLI